MVAVLVFAALCAAAFAQNNPDACSPHPDCQSCVGDKDHICGWCSTHVIYSSGLEGANCVSNDGSHPFACFGVFSTEDCLAGYVCNNNTHVCEQTSPGQGVPYSECVTQCGAQPGPSPPAPTYICNTTLNSCVQSEAGTSLTVCLSTCENAPAVPSPPTQPTDVYLCNQTSLECKNVPYGTPGSASKVVCQSQCTEQYYCDFSSYSCVSGPNGTVSKAQCQQACVPLYKCDDSIGQCVVAPYPTPGVPLAECQENCKKSNNTPSDLTGLWRGLMVQDGFTAGEFDIKFTDGQMYVASSVSQGFSGLVSFVGTVDRRMLEVTVGVSNMNGVSVGDTLNMVYAVDGATPETRFIMIASGAPNKQAPDTWDTAMTNDGGFTFSMTVCQPLTSCAFKFISNWESTKKSMQSKRNMMAMSLLDTDEPVGVDDSCSQYVSCSTCIAHTNCGWCSVDVTYRDGTPGTHCAGSFPNGTRIQFTCSGIYRTDDCSDYQCVMPQAICATVPLGGGMSKSECEQSCVPVPASPSPLPPPPPGPSPPADLYMCNTTSHVCQLNPAGTSYRLCQDACQNAPAVPSQPTPPTPVAATYLCNTTSKECYRAQPGEGTSLVVCENTCVNNPPPPSPGPAPPLFNGTLRGIEIDNQYQVGEWNLKFNADKFEFDLDGTKKMSGTVYSASQAGGLTLAFDGGSTVGAIYTVTDGLELQKITLVISNNATAPDSWDQPWILGGDHGSEWVFIRKEA